MKEKKNLINELFENYKGNTPELCELEQAGSVGLENLEEDMTPYEKLVNGNKAKMERVDFRWDQEGTELL